MGINFPAGHPRDVFTHDYADKVVRQFRQSFVTDVPLGTPGRCFCLEDEMGWSWWSCMQRFAAEKLGASGARQIAAVDAWLGVYLDTDVERVILWPEGMPAPGEADEPKLVGNIASGGSWISRILRRLGRRDPGLPTKPEAAIREMMAAHGARPGERRALQVGNLRVLTTELAAVLEAIGVDRTEAAVDALRRSYAQCEDRVDDDPEIQCLCHARLTASHAAAQRVPLWLVK